MEDSEDQPRQAACEDYPPPSEIRTEPVRPFRAKGPKSRRMESVERTEKAAGGVTGDEAKTDVDASALQSIRGVLEALRCPNCAAYLYPPVSLCGAGHSLCVDCCEDGRCPLRYCRRNLLLHVRNSPLENVALAVLMRCDYSAQGCDVVLPRSEARDHSRVCSRRPQQCPMLDPWCEWTGTANSLAHHVQEQHPIHIMRSSEIEVLVGGPLGTLDTFGVLLCLGDRFLARVRVGGRIGGHVGGLATPHVAAAVQYLGDRRSASDFTFDTLVFDVSDCNDANAARPCDHASACGCEGRCGPDALTKRMRRRVLQRLPVLDVGLDLDRVLDSPTSSCFRAPLDPCDCYPAHFLRVRFRIEENY